MIFECTFTISIILSKWEYESLLTNSTLNGVVWYSESMSQYCNDIPRQLLLAMCLTYIIAAFPVFAQSQTAIYQLRLQFYRQVHQKS